jgi:hypothetical protein
MLSRARSLAARLEPRITAPGVELSGEMLKDIQLGFVISEHCSTGQLSLVNLRKKGRSVVYP